MSITARERMRRCAVLLALLGLILPAGADLVLSHGAPTTPALASSRILYQFTPSVQGGGTWGEEALDRMRLRRSETVTWEQVPDEAEYILGAIEGVAEPQYLATNTEGPVAVEVPGAAVAESFIGDGRIEGALAEVGLGVEDLVPKYEMPWLALAVADFFFGLYRQVFDLMFNLRSLLQGDVQPPSAGPEMEGDPAFTVGGIDDSDVLRGGEFDAPKGRPLVIAKRVARSALKILLGLCLGVLVWGFVRNL